MLYVDLQSSSASDFDGCLTGRVAFCLTAAIRTEAGVTAGEPQLVDVGQAATGLFPPPASATYAFHSPRI